MRPFDMGIDRWLQSSASSSSSPPSSSSEVASSSLASSLPDGPGSSGGGRGSGDGSGTGSGTGSGSGAGSGAGVTGGGSGSGAAGAGSGMGSGTGIGSSTGSDGVWGTGSSSGSMAPSSPPLIPARSATTKPRTMAAATPRTIHDSLSIPYPLLSHSGRWPYLSRAFGRSFAPTGRLPVASLAPGWEKPKIGSSGWRVRCLVRYAPNTSEASLASVGPRPGQGARRF